MVRIVLVAFLFMAAQVPATPVATPTGDVCADLRTYFAELDTLMFTDMANVAADPEWQAAMERTNRKVEATESGILALNLEDFEPMVALYEVPGDVLLDYPEDEIPAIAEEFHDSAMRYWIVMPAMMRAMGGGGAFAALVYSEDMDIASMDNLRGIARMSVACPDVISEVGAGAEAAPWSSLLSNTEDMLPAEERDVPPGFSYSIMTDASAGLVEELQGRGIDSVRHAAFVPAVRR